MKKIILAALLLAGCSSKEKQLIAKGEEYLKSQMNDPKSYEPVSAKIADTTTYVEYFTQWKTKDSFALELAKIGGSPTEIELKQSAYDSDLKHLKEAKSGEIRHITLQYEFRAKNGFGAVTKGSQLVTYFPSQNKFEVEK